MEDISNQDIVNFIEEKYNENLKRNFVGVFPSNYIKFISFHRMMIGKKECYPSIIMNTDQSNKTGTHWSSFLDLHPKKEIFLFDSFGFEGFNSLLCRTIERFLIKFYLVWKD